MLKHEHSKSAPAAVLAAPSFPAALTWLPVVFLAGQVLTDLAYWRTAQTWWAQGSAMLAGTVLASAALVTLFRLTDFVTIKRSRTRGQGRTLLLANVGVLSLALLNLWLRLDNPTAFVFPWGLGLSLVMLALYA